MKKVKFKFLLMIAFLGLAFVAFISFSPNVNGESGVVRDTDVYVSDGEYLTFDEQSQMQHYIYVSGSGNVAFSMTFDNYNYYAGEYEGCMEVILDDANISSLLINISVIGYCAMYGGNHPGLRVPGGIPVFISISMEDDSKINIGSQDGSKAIRNQYDTYDNIDYRLVNVYNAQGIYEQLRYTQDSDCMISSANGHPNSNYPADEPYQPSDNPQSGESVIVNFSANDNIVSQEVTLPHSFMCDFSSEEGELDLIIQQLYGLNNGGFCDSNLPDVYGESISSIECSIINEDNLCITINEAFTGSVIVEGSYYGRANGKNERFNYSIVITTGQQSGNDPEPGDNPQGDFSDFELVMDNYVEVSNNSKIQLTAEYEMNHDINVSGSGLVQLGVLLNNYNYSSDNNAGLVFRTLDDSIETLCIDLIVAGDCSLCGGDYYPGIVFETTNTNIYLSIIMLENSHLIISSSNDDVAAINAGISMYDIGLELINVKNAQQVYESIKYGNLPIYTLEYNDDSGQTNPEQQPIYAYENEIEVYDRTTVYFVSGCEMTHHINIHGSEIVDFAMIFEGYNFIASQDEDAIVFNISDSSITTVNVTVIVRESNKILGNNVPGFLLPNNTQFTFDFTMEEYSSLIIGTQDGSRGIRRGNGSYNNIEYYLNNVENAEELYDKLMNGNNDVFTFISQGSGQGDHEHIYEWRIIQEPTCNEKGHEEYVCLECGQKIDERYTEPLGHDFVWDIYTEPTCEEFGERQQVCQRCGEPGDVELIEPLGHDFITVSAQEATTEHEGWSEYQKCQRCGVETEHETYPMLVEPTVVTTEKVYIGNGDSILFNNQSQITHYIYVDGSGNVTITMTFDNYKYTSGRWAGCMEILLESESITRLYVNIIVKGDCELIGGNHPGLRVPNIPVYLTFNMEENSSITFGSQDVNWGIQDGNNEASNINYTFNNVRDEDSVRNSLTSTHYTIYSTDYDVHEHVCEWRIIEEPTCYGEGYEEYVCLECGKKIDERYTEPLGHDFVWEINKEPTCEESGNRQQVCQRCGEPGDMESIEPLGHDFVLVPAQEATTEHEGWSEYQKCQRCGFETEHETYPMLKEPTVVTTETVHIGNGDSILFNNQSRMQHYIYVDGSGNVTITMTFDNYKYEAGRWAGCMEIKIESVTRLYVNIIVKGDCELIGGNHPGLRVPNIPVYLTFTMEENSSITFGSQDSNWGIQNGNDEASNIDFKFNNVRDEDSVRNSLTSTHFTIYSTDYGVHDHEYEWVIYEEPTCEDNGYKVLKCTICGEEIQWENIDPLGHDFVWDINKEPTCEESGERQQVCQRCGELGDVESIEPLGHNWSKPTYEWSEDYTTLTATRVCLNDNSHVETETVEVTLVESIDPTCEDNGERFYISAEFENPAFAQQEISILIEALGHNWSEPTYEWSKDYTTLTATRVCLNDNSHVETETVEVTLVESIDPTCEDNGERFYISAEFENSAFVQQEISIVIEALGHDLIYHKAKAATFDEAGWDEYYTCSRCDYVSEYNIRPILERPDMDNPEAQEEFKEQVTQNITNIIGDSDTQEEISDNIANTPVEVLADIIDVVGSAYNAVNDMFADTEEGEKIEVQPGVELTKEEAIEIIQSVTMSTIVIAGSQESQIEAATELTNSLPADSGIDMGGIVSDFYERVLSELLSSPNNNNENVNSIVHKNNGNITNNLNAIFNSSVLSNNPLIENMLKITVKFNPFDKDEPADANASSGIDYSVSAETYQNAIEFVNTSVNNMADAALRIRQCSGEAMKSTINHYISGVSVQSFRDFDRAKADQEFAEAAYKAILISLQETVMNSLTENFEKAKAGKSGRALKDLEEAYEAEMEQVSHLHFLEDKTDEECEGCFEDVVIEVMRLKFLSILNNKRDSKEITDELFTQYAALAVDEETFAPVYKDIFFCWATGAESNLEIEITLQELSDAAIENTSTKINPESVDVKMLPVDWIILSSFVLVALGLGVGYFLISRKKKGAE